MAVAAIKNGAFDFIEKPVDDRILVASINRALAFVNQQQGETSARVDLQSHFSTLTAREVEVFDLITAGLTNFGVGDRLGISVRTVESYRAQIMNKMQADGLATLVRQAIRLNRLDP
jgi:two-component system response regulator FixJ